MEKKKKYIRRAAAVCLAALILLAASEGIKVQALFDEDEAVHIDASEIDDGTLIIGTHLIHMDAMGDEIYGIADGSASESSQMNRYYKSELADGSWFDITDAESVKDITKEGTPVEDRVIEELFLTHRTGADGITYDLRTGNAVCMFDLTNPYDLENLSELEPLKLQYDILRDKTDKSKTDEFCEEEIRRFFRTEVRDGETDRLDAQLEALQRAYQEAGADRRPAIASTMEAVDASRRRLVLEKLVEPLKALLELLQGKGADIEGDEAHFEVNSELNSGASESVGNVEESILAHSAKELSEGSTSLAKEEYAIRRAMIDAAEAGDGAALSDAVERMALLKNIMENTAGNGEDELNYLKNIILPDAMEAYSSRITEGEGKSYREAASSSNVSQGVLKEALKEQLNVAEAARSELQFLVGVAAGKMDAKACAEFIEELLGDVRAMESEIKEDAFEEYAKSSTGAYLSYLEDRLANSSQTENVKALSELLDEKSKKQEEKQEALDRNDLEGARKAEAELDALNEKIDALETKMSRAKENLGDAALDGSDTEARLRTAFQSAQLLSKQAQETIREGNLTGVAEKIDGLSALISANPDAALNGLQDVYKALASQAYLAGTGENEKNSPENTGMSEAAAFEECMAKVEDVVAENGAAFNNSGLSEEQAKEALEEVAGKKIEEQSEEEKAALLKASLDLLEQQANEGIRKMAETLAAQMEANDSPYIFRQYNDPVEEYIPAKTISRCLGYRYVYDNNRQKATLSKKNDYYTFRAFQAEYEKGGEKGSLGMNAGFQGDVYLSEKDCAELFKCAAQYVPGSNLSLLITQEGGDQASAYLSMLLTRLGG